MRAAQSPRGRNGWLQCSIAFGSTDRSRLSRAVRAVSGAPPRKLSSRRGARAVLLDRDADEAQRVASELGNAEAHALDVTSETAVDGLIDTLASRIGRIDILVNNAGVSIRKA